MTCGCCVDGFDESGGDAEGLDGLRGGGREEEREVGGELGFGSKVEEKEEIREKERREEVLISKSRD